MYITQQQWMPNVEKNPNKRLEVGSWPLEMNMCCRFIAYFHHNIIMSYFPNLRSSLLKLSIKSMVSFSSLQFEHGFEFYVYNRFTTTKTKLTKRTTNSVTFSFG